MCCGFVIGLHMATEAEAAKAETQNVEAELSHIL